MSHKDDAEDLLDGVFAAPKDRVSLALTHAILALVEALEGLAEVYEED